MNRMMKELSLVLFLPILWVYAAFIFLRLLTGDILESEKYSSITQVAFQTLALTLFIVLALSGLANRKRTRNPHRYLDGYWLGSFLFLILEISALLLFIDPHARIGLHYFQPITFDARAIKAEFYEEQPAPPEVVVMGSSRAFTLSPVYIRQQTGYESFNFSVEGGRVGDFVVQLNFMQKSGYPPRVLIVDVNHNTMTKEYHNADLQPLALTPYMPASMRLSVFDSILHDVTSVQTISDSAYLFAATGGQGWIRGWFFQENGLGFRKDASHGQYVELLKYTINRRIKSMQCNSLDPSARAAFERFLGQAQENGIGIILYQSPVHAEFYRVAREDNPSNFDLCRGLASEYFHSLVSAFPNVSYSDLLAYEPVAFMGEDGYYDAYHLKPAASQLVVDALIPEIQKAMAWALAR